MRRHPAVRRPAAAAALAAAALAALAVAADAARAATLHVDITHPACADDGAGAPNRPFCRIGAAAARATPGDTVEVASGTYAERVAVPSGTAAAPITFTAAPGATVVVTGQANGFSVSGRHHVTIRGFVVSDTTSHGIAVQGSSHIALVGNTVRHAGSPAPGQTASGIRLSDVTDSVVVGNIVHDNTSYGINVVDGSTRNAIDSNRVFANAMGWQRAASGIRLFASPGNTVTRNLTHANEDSGIEFVTGSSDNLAAGNVSHGNGDHGIDTYRSPGVRIVGNTVHGNRHAAGIDVEADSHGATIRNNIAVGNGVTVDGVPPRTKGNIRVDASSQPGTTLDSDLVWQASPEERNIVWGPVSYETLDGFRAVAPGQEAHGIEADPRWRDPAAGDFRLTAGSPAIDSADSTVAGQLVEDIDGTLRQDDPATPDTGIGPPRTYDDRGAYEFGQAAPDGPAVPGGPAPEPSGGPSPGPPANPVGGDAPAGTAAQRCTARPTARVTLVRRRSARTLEVRGSARAARGCPRLRRVVVRLARRDGRTVVAARARGTARWTARLRLPRRGSVRALRVRAAAVDAAGRAGGERVGRRVPSRIVRPPSTGGTPAMRPSRTGGARASGRREGGRARAVRPSRRGGTRPAAVAP
jgi:parallel beta-helix repeat protein